MYVSTFYSFKGGVGRTMALVNAAVELARRGRKVLAVDFDLEAPGLDTFEVLRAPPASAGIVDFVIDYLATGQAPDVSRFVNPSAAVDGLWVMPSGSQQSYAASFGEIDWNNLYEQHSGYLLFEDLKEQWRKIVQPDYVLIDSRTGHTDTCGICTRQLPDAVTLLFFPNEQNLRGLAKVVRDIRAEADAPQGRRIDTHFVMSNVPDLDDEDDILRRMLGRFTADLGMVDEPQVIHRYDSLSLLNQVVFTQDRPKSRLSKEYRSVVDLIVRANFEDEEGALHYIKDARSSFDPSYDVERKLTKIEEHHANNGDVLFRLGELASDESNWARARLLLDRAVDLGNQSAACLLARAHILRQLGENAAAIADAKRVLAEPDLPPQAVRDAIGLAELDVPEDAGELPAVATMDGWRKIWLAAQLERDGETRACVSVLRSALGRSDARGLRKRTVGQLALSLIAIGDLEEACDLLSSDGAVPASMDVQDAFNYGMAKWGLTGYPPGEAFERVVSLNKADGEEDRDANYLQCMAVAHWVVGEAEEALEFVRRAKAEAEATLQPTFSCWCYRTVATQNFLRDTDSIMRLIAGETGVVPAFVKRRVAARGKYAPLFHHLDALDADRWPATFREIEAILGSSLPNSARVHRPWWSNQASGHSHALAWQAAGWRTTAVDLKEETLLFVRCEEVEEQPA